MNWKLETLGRQISLHSYALSDVFSAKMLPLQYFSNFDDQNKEGTHQSIVIKAKVNDEEAMESSVFEMTESLGTMFLQEDVYFNTPAGNLKLRIMHPNRAGHLIYNEISKKTAGQRMSESQITEVEDVFSLRNTLGAALGERGSIKKKRRVFLTEDVRIYLDDVEQIGSFIDIAVTKSGTPEECLKRAEEVRNQLGIDDKSVVPLAYLDLLMSNISLDEDDTESNATSFVTSDFESEETNERKATTTSSSSMSDMDSDGSSS